MRACSRSSLVSENLQTQLVQCDLLGLGAIVGHDASADAVLHRLWHLVYLHEIFKVKIEPRQLIDQGEVIDGYGIRYLSRLVGDVCPDFRAMLLHVDD